MIPIREARRQLKKTGTSHASGDALRYMYANLLAFEHRMSIKADSIKYPIPEIYEHFAAVPDDAVQNEYRRLSGSFPEFWAILS